MITRRLWTQTVLFFAALLLLAGLIWMLLVARPLLNSLIVAALWAYLLDPAVRRVERRFQWQRPIAATLVYTINILVVAGLIVTLGATVWGQASRRAQELHSALVVIENWFAQPIIVQGFALNLQPLFASLEESANNALARLPLGTGTILSSVTNNLLWSLAILISLYYFLKDGTKIKPWLLSLLPTNYVPEADYLLNQFNTIWSVFLRMQLLILAILGLLLGISNVLIIWFYRLGWLSLSPLGLVLLLIVVYTAIQQVDNLWLRPRLMGRTLHLHPGIVIVSLIAALALSGVMAAIIVVPLIATLQVIAKYAYAKALGRPFGEEIQEE